MITLFIDAHTLEIGLGYAPDFCSRFLDDLKESGPQLKTIRFEIPEELVVYRFEHGRPFSVVERMVVDESERVSRKQDVAWRSYYDNYCLDQYVRPE